MSVLRLTLISDPSKFKKGLDAASKELKGLRATANSVSAGLNKALGAAGVGLGVAALTGLLKESARAAAEDAVSKNQLALSLRNTLKATDATVAGAEKWIQTTSNAVAILDDDLRPALATAVRATGNLTQGQALLTLALDISAATGKNLGTVTNALSKAHGGQLTSLQKLVPGIKLAKNWYSQLTEQFKGSARAAADLNPYQRLTVLFENLKEEIGVGLLPIVEQFNTYLSSPEGQRNLRQIIEIIKGIGVGLGTMVKLVLDNIAVIKSLVAAILFVKTAIGLMTFAMKLYDTATKLAKISTTGLKAALVSTGIGALVVAVGLLAQAWLEADANANQYLDTVDPNTAPPGSVQGPGLGPGGETWLAMGYSSFEEYQFAMEESARQIEETRQRVAEAIKSSGEKFRDAVGLAFGVRGRDDASIFNADIVIEKLKRIVDAARGFKDNLKRLVRQGAGQDVVAELVAMGPAQGNIVAKGLLSSGRLSEYLGLRGSLYQTGLDVGAIQQNTGEKSYTININKANVTAADIISEIRKFEKATNKKYFVN